MSQTANHLIQWLRHVSSVADRDAGERIFAPRVVAELAERGLLGLQIGAEHGGLALDHGDTARVLEQLGGVDLGAALFVGLNNYLGVWPILRHGQLPVREQLLPRLAKGECLAGFAMVEPRVGINSSAWSCEAQAVNGSGWKIFGTKFLSNGTRDSTVFNVFVRHRERQDVSGFVVSRAAAEVRHDTPVGDDGIARQSVSLEGLFLKHDDVLGQIGQGMQIALSAIQHSHLAIGAACLGGMKRCSQLIFQHATQRQGGGGAVLAHPVTITKLG
ncbi:MAG: hypothetical protein RL685_4776, partial [Pseudomonadota bacterium]